MTYGTTNQYGRLGGGSPSAGVLADGYAVPARTMASVKVVIANLGSAATVRLAHAPAGAADALSQYMLYDFPLAANDAISTDEFSLSAGDIIRIRSNTGSVAFNINGKEERTRTA